MTLRSALMLLAVVALLTPVASMLGVYETSFEQLLGFAGPVLGAASAIGFMRFLARRA
jgi:hypothetical protein